MNHPHYGGISCERCGVVSPPKFQSCPHRSKGACPFVLKERTSHPAKLPGFLMTGIGLVFMFGSCLMPFTMYSKGVTGVYSLIVGTLVLTFAFSVSSIFVLFGLASAGLRKSLFYDRAQLRYVETWNILGLPLAYRLVQLGEIIPLQVTCPPLPLSLAGFLMESSQSVFPPLDFETPPEIQSSASARFAEINTQLDQSIAHALLGAIANLIAHSCIVFRRARQETLSRWYAIADADTYYIQAADGRSDDLGLLETELLHRIVTWCSQAWKVDDIIAPTFADLIKTFQDSDGDFSAYQVRKLLLIDGESRKLFAITREGLLGRLLPKIEPTPEAAGRIREAQELIEDFGRRFLGNQSGLGNNILFAVRKTVFGDPDRMGDPVHKENVALRKRLLYYVIVISFALSLVLSGIAIL